MADGNRSKRQTGKPMNRGKKYTTGRYPSLIPAAAAGPEVVSSFLKELVEGDDDADLSPELLFEAYVGAKQMIERTRLRVYSGLSS